MLVPDVTAPVPAAFELTFHVTAPLGLLVPVTEALNWRVLPAATDCPDGLTVTLVTAGAGGGVDAGGRLPVVPPGPAYPLAQGRIRSA